MQNIFEKRMNKVIIGTILGGALLGLGGLSMSPKGKGFWRKVLDKIKGFTSFMGGGVSELRKKIGK